MRNALASLLCLVAAGCATAPRQPPEVKTVYVSTSSCPAPTLPAEPAWMVDALQIGAPIDEQIKALVAEREQRKGYEIELRAAIVGDK